MENAISTTSPSAFSFGDEVWAGCTSTVEVSGFTLTATVRADDDCDPPWSREDGHGPVSEWRRRGYDGQFRKAPGELLLVDDRGSARFYGFAEACKIARRDGWGVTGGKRDGETARAYAARAALADYDRLRRWCNGQWSYVGVSVTVERNGVELVREYECACWGIESDCGEHVARIADECASEALELAAQRIQGLAA